MIGALRDLYTAFRPKPWPLERPIVLQFPVNDICNSGCEMCHIWKKKLDSQITPAELQQVLRDPLYSRIVNVGINGGEPTLRRDLPDLARVVCTMLPRLRRLSLITNALVPKRVNGSIAALGEVAREYGKHLDVMISLDGVGALHDRVRGRAGNFEAVLKVLEFVATAPGVASHQLGCTIVKDNVYGLWDVLEFALANEVYIKFRLGVPHQRLYTYELREPFALDADDRYHVCVFLQNLMLHYESGAQQLETYRSLIGQLAYREPRRSGCNWQHRGVTLTSRGELAYCAVESKNLGNAIHACSEDLYFGHRDYLHEIIKTKCDGCSHDYGGISTGRGFIRQILAQLGFSPVRMRRQTRFHRLLAPLARVAFTRHYRGWNPARAPLAHARAQVAPGRVLICGWYGTETLGDKAILAGIVSSLRAEDAGAMFTIASLEPYVTRNTVAQMPELAGVEVLDFRAAIARGADFALVAFGGGPVMGVKALAENIGVFRYAAARNIPRLLLGCGVGPIGRGFYRPYLRELLELASVRIYRDEESRQLATALGVNTGADLVAEDPALTWLAAQCRATQRSSADDTRNVVLGLREWPHEQYGGSPFADERLRQRLDDELGRGLLELLAAAPNVRLVPLPMSTNAAGGDDRWYYRKLFRESRLPRERIDWSTLERELTPLEALRHFHAGDCVVGMRFHALVFGVASGVPTLAIDYTLGRGKVAAFANRVGTPSLALDDLTGPALAANIASLLSDRTPSAEYSSGSLKFQHALHDALSRCH